MFVEITASKVGQVVGTAIIAAIGGTATISVAINRVWRLVKKDGFHKDTGMAVQQIACAAEEQINVAQHLKQMTEEMRKDAQEERNIYREILSAQQQINASQASILQQLQTLILMRNNLEGR